MLWHVMGSIGIKFMSQNLGGIMFEVFITESKLAIIIVVS